MSSNYNMDTPLTYGELFAGVGGLGLAVEEVFGAELAWYSEIDKAPSAVMAHHWPGVPNLGDVSTVDWSTVPKVDIISGGSPCQDVSHAGRRAGMAEGTRSGLWASMREAIATIRPTYVIWENVRGVTSAKATSASDLEQGEGQVGDNLRALGRVLGDLVDLGYDAQWHGLRASDIGAPHQRYRIFLLATRRDATHGHSLGGDGGGARGAGRAESQDGNRQPVALPPTPVANLRNDVEPLDVWRARRAEVKAKRGNGNGFGKPLVVAAREVVESGSLDWGEYEPCVRRWEALTRPAPDPTEPAPRGGRRLSAAFCEWMMGWPKGWVTEVPGTNRNQQIKACGNGVHTQQAAAALSHMLNRQQSIPSDH